MNKKIGLIVSMILFLVIALFSSPLTFAQSAGWAEVQISAYGTNLVEGDPVPETFSFTVVVPPSGSEITNTVYVLNEDTGENYTKTLAPGDIVVASYIGMSPQVSIINAAEPDHYIISYDGEATGVSINSTYIPEFSPILIVPMFIAATLLAIFYRRKRTSQNQPID